MSKVFILFGELFQQMQEVSTPTGWLLHPKGEMILFFIQDPKSLQRLPRVITQLWYAIDGVPIRIKNSRTMDLLSAIETWNELINSDWVLVEQEHKNAS